MLIPLLRGSQVRVEFTVSARTTGWLDRVRGLISIFDRDDPTKRTEVTAVGNLKGVTPLD
jgi:hypothetical protein